jgi:hypothetical protein
LQRGTPVVAGVVGVVVRVVEVGVVAVVRVVVGVGVGVGVIVVGVDVGVVGVGGVVVGVVEVDTHLQHSDGSMIVPSGQKQSAYIVTTSPSLQ